MKNIGIVAEYNPFHNGHAYHIEQARKIAGGGSVIAVMSASFVQRGEPAAFDKFTRTAMALQGGADMVLELPDILSLSCAERFALISGAVRDGLRRDGLLLGGVDGLHVAVFQHDVLL